MFQSDTVRCHSSTRKKEKKNQIEFSKQLLFIQIFLDKTNLLHPMERKQDARFRIKGQLAMTLYLKPSKLKL